MSDVKPVPMWAYWRDKKGVRGAVDQYPKAMEVASIAAAVHAYDRAEIALNALMYVYDEERGDQ